MAGGTHVVASLPSGTCPSARLALQAVRECHTGCASGHTRPPTVMMNRRKLYDGVRQYATLYLRQSALTWAPKSHA